MKSLLTPYSSQCSTFKLWLPLSASQFSRMHGKSMSMTTLTTANPLVPPTNKHFQGTVDGTGCVNIGPANPPSGVTCSLHSNGGNANPTACDGTDLTADSAILSEIKDAGAKPNRYGMHLLRSGRLQ
ncbi:hypothetical protein TMatcc_001179 [Talaromyces marneffei ATCC 18224]